jgi:hypothetical protein
MEGLGCILGDFFRKLIWSPCRKGEKISVRLFLTGDNNGKKCLLTLLKEWCGKATLTA